MEAVKSMATCKGQGAGYLQPPLCMQGECEPKLGAGTWGKGLELLLHLLAGLVAHWGHPTARRGLPRTLPTPRLCGSPEDTHPAHWEGQSS